MTTRRCIQGKIPPMCQQIERQCILWTQNRSQIYIKKQYIEQEKTRKKRKIEEEEINWMRKANDHRRIREDGRYKAMLWHNCPKRSTALPSTLLSHFCSFHIKDIYLKNPRFITIPKHIISKILIIVTLVKTTVWCNSHGEGWCCKSGIIAASSRHVSGG